MRNRIIPALRKLPKNTSGAALIEFAMIVPIFFVILMGTIVMTDVLIAYRRTQSLVGNLGNVFSFDDLLTKNELQGYSEVVKTLLFPYDEQDVSILVLSISFDGVGAPTTDWCLNYRPGTSTVCSGTPVTGNWTTKTAGLPTVSDIPAHVVQPNTTIIVTSVTLNWAAPYNYLLSDLTISDRFFNSPRAPSGKVNLDSSIIP